MLRRPFTWHRFCLAHPQWQPSPDLLSLTSFRLFSSSPILFEDDPPPDSPPLASSATDRVQQEKATSGDETTIQSSRSPDGIRTRTRSRSLRPLLIPPTFPHNIIPELPISDTQLSRIQEEEGGTDSSAIITLENLPPNTFKVDIRPIFQRFGEVRRIVLGLGGTRADIIFADAEGVKRTLHAYAEQPFFVRGREVVVFRKCAREASNGFRAVNDDQADTNTAWQANPSRSRIDRDDGRGAIFVSQFPQGTTQEELWEALLRFGNYEKFVMRPGSRYAYFMYSSADRVEHILRSHERIPITIRGENLRIERTVNRPYTLSPGSSDISLELGKPLDPAESQAIIEELKQTVPRWRGSYEPSRVLWVGRLPTNFTREALSNFWSRLGCVVEVRPSMSGFAHIEFSSTEEALRAARQGAPHGFRYKDRLLDVDFAPWLFYIGPGYRFVYISGWPASNTRPELLQWAYDIPHVTGAAVFPPFRGEERSAPRCAFLHFRTIDDARAGLHMLDGREGPGGEALRVSLSCPTAVHLKRLWGWAYAEEEIRQRGEKVDVHFEREWAGLGFGTGAEDQQLWRDGPGYTSVPPVGTRGGRVSLRGQTEVAGAGVFADGSQESGDRRDETLEEAMLIAGEDAGRADPGVRRGLPYSRAGR
ncbi:hypothetical protein EDB87DRAFT_1419965 [Lactarius vividus]|nr:hypothetical protein EDB87DRAFT_1419965 [Lactarius vividus]